jgi:quinol monooxygenase YgiN
VAVTLIYEVWASEESWRKHIATDHLQAFKTQVIDVSASMSVDKLRFDDGG